MTPGKALRVRAVAVMLNVLFIYLVVFHPIWKLIVFQCLSLLRTIFIVHVFGCHLYHATNTTPPPRYFTIHVTPLAPSLSLCGMCHWHTIALFTQKTMIQSSIQCFKHSFLCVMCQNTVWIVSQWSTTAATNESRNQSIGYDAPKHNMHCILSFGSLWQQHW